MPTPRRRAWAAQNPVPVVTGGIDRAWNGATQAWQNGVDRATDVAGYTVQNPIEAARDMGDFSEDAARAIWDTVQDKWGLGQQWWNAVVDVWESPCEGRWWVYLETMLPAAGNALWILLVPSPDEILENYLQPYPSKRNRRGDRRSDPDERRRSKSGRKRRSWPIVPDVDSTVAAYLPGSAAVKGRDVGNGQRWLFQGIDLADRVGWYWLVAEVSENFVVGWTTGLRNSEHCSDPQTVYLWVEPDTLPKDGGQPGSLFDNNNVVASTGGTYGAHVFDFDPRLATAMCTLSVEFRNDDEKIRQEIDWSIQLQTPDGPINEEKHTITEPGEHGRVQMSITADAASAATVSATITHGYNQTIHWQHAQFLVMAPGSKQPRQE